MIIDPDLAWATYLGAGYADYGRGMTVDLTGGIYVTGHTTSSGWATAGAYDTINNAGDAFVAKLDSTGASLVYATYLGGASTDYGKAIAVDSSGNAYVTGYTNSSSWMTVGAYDTTYNGLGDVFVAKLNTSGSSLLYATYLGGANSDEGQSIAVDSAGNAYVTGYTASPGWATAGAYDTSCDGGIDAFVAKLDGVGHSLIYASYLGGGAYDYGEGIAVDTHGTAYVTGETNSSGWATPGAYDTTYNGDYDVFAAEMDSTGSSLLYASYLGGGLHDVGFGIAVDSEGNAYLVGSTLSPGWATAEAYDPTYNGGYDVFVAELNNTGSGILYITYFGGSDAEEGLAISVDQTGNAYVTGYTSSSDWATPGAYDTTINGLWDVFMAKVSSGGTSLLYASYLGGDDVDEGWGVAADLLGNIFLTGQTESSGWGTSGAYDPSYNGNTDVFVAEFTGLNALFGVSRGTLSLDQASPALRFTFDRDLSSLSIDPTDIVIHSVLPGGALGGSISATGAAFDSATKTMTFTLPSSIPNGNYRATLPAGSVTDTNGNPLTVDFTFDFFLLAGDANHDGVVDINDLFTLATNWQGTGKTYSQGDFNYDGSVNSADLSILAANWQHTPAGMVGSPTSMPIPPGISQPAPRRTAFRVVSLIQ